MLKKKIILIFFILISLINASYASVKEKIINNLIGTDNLIFDFKQTISKKTEKGNCIIKYPKKIYCVYKNRQKKIMVSNGKTLVVKNRSNNQNYVYPLKKTPLSMILDKKYIISQIEKLRINNITDDTIDFLLIDKNIKINIFFDKETNNLKGWQTEDMYQNKVSFIILNLKTNQKIDRKIFKLPKLN